MVSRKEVIEEFGRLTTFKDIFETYEEIAASRMQAVRTSVIRSRTFVDGLNSVFAQVKESYKDKIAQILKRNKSGKQAPTFIKRNGKTVFVLLSSNTGLYGDVIERTFSLFARLVQKEKTDAVIIGRIGLELFKNADLPISYNYFDFPDASINDQDLKKIITYLIQYEKIFVVYGRFENIISQEPVVTGISGDIPAQENTGPKLKYLFEPSLDQIMEFFEKEMFASIFEQTIYESQLAKFAARMSSLETRVEKIKERLKEVALEKDKIKHRTMNKKQLETFSTMVLWK